MTFTLNGVGTTLCGERWINQKEFDRLSRNEEFREVLNHLANDDKLKIETKDDLFRFKIATKSFSLLFIPIIPLETFIFYSPKTKWYQEESYIPLFYPNKGKVDWSHVKSTWSFYILPCLFLFALCYGIFSFLF